MGLELCYYLLIFAAAFFIGRSSSAKLATPPVAAVTARAKLPLLPEVSDDQLPDKYVVSKTAEIFHDAKAICHLRYLTPSSLDDLNKDSNNILTALSNAAPIAETKKEEEFYWYVDTELRGLMADGLDEPLKQCYKFKPNKSEGFDKSPADCMERHRSICKPIDSSTFRTIVSHIKEKVDSAVSKSRRFGRWIKEKLKKVNEFTANELYDAVHILKDSFRETSSKIGSKVADFTNWTKEHAKGLVHKIGDALSWSKDKIKGVWHKVFGDINDEFDDEFDDILEE